MCYVTDIEFSDPYTLLAQNTNGTFTQLDMRDISKPIDAVSRMATCWTPQGGIGFVLDRSSSWEVPYDDMYVASPGLLPSLIFLLTPLVI